MEEIVREEDERGVTGCCGKSHRALATSAPAPALPQASQPVVWLWVSEAGSEASGPNRAVDELWRMGDDAVSRGGGVSSSPVPAGLSSVHLQPCRWQMGEGLAVPFSWQTVFS